MGRRDRWAWGGYAALAAGTLALAEALQRRGVPVRLTRKLVHVVAGLSPLFVTALATSKRAAVAPYALTTVANALAWRRGTFRSLVPEQDTPGIVYFPVVQALLLAALWSPDAQPPRRATVRGALLTLALADAAAALVGHRVGRRSYTLFGHRRTLEGSSAMFVVTGLVVAAARAGAGQRVAGAALCAAAVATVAEGASPQGLDNLTVPPLVALVLLIQE